MKKKYELNRPVVEVNDKNQILAYWLKAADCCKETRVNRATLSQVLSGRMKKADRRFFRYATPTEVALHKDLSESGVKKSPVIVDMSEAGQIPAEHIDATVVQLGEYSRFEELLQRRRIKNVSTD